MPHPTWLPEVFAIDEFKGNTGAQKYQCILTDPVHGRVLDILPDRRSSHLIKHSKRLLTKWGTKLTKDERERVEAMLYLSHELRQAYHLKERFYEVLDAKEPEVSAKLMGAWILEAHNSGLIEYENCRNTFIA